MFMFGNVGRGSSFPYPPLPSSSHSRYTRTYITLSDLVVHIYIHFLSCVLQEEKFQPLSQFARVSDFKYTLNRLKHFQQRQFRANGKNDKRRLYYQCSTVIGNVIPPNRKDGGCPFFLRTTKEHDGTVIIREVNLRHTCTIVASSAAHGSKLAAPLDELTVEAAYAVRHTARSLRGEAVKERMQDRGFKVPPSPSCAGK